LGSAAPQPSGPRINFIDAVRRTLEGEMRLNPRLLVFGEDVGVKGGVHGATLDMQQHFGVERVFDTSLSEEGIMGRAVGMALAGLLPVPEIQFRKYADPAHEQISDLGTLRWRTANRFAAPVVVRIPVGFGKKTGDPWHSVSGEAVFAHTLGWRIAYPSHAEDAVGLLRTALRGDDPTFFFEHRALLDTPEGRRPYPGDDFCLPFGQAARLSDGDALTVVTWGGMVPRCLEAAKAFQGQVALLDLRTIIPWDQEAVLESVRRTGKVLVVHEDTLTAGFAGEIIAVIASQAFTDLDAPPERLTTPDVLIPYNLGLKDAVLPGVKQIRQKMSELLSY
jgi:2-oxoisovalerate dehydrogenase E1 component